MVNYPRSGIFLLFACLGAIFPPIAPAAFAADEFVGTLALAVKDDVAVQLKLTSEQKNNLLDLIDRRESEAVGPAMEIRNLPPEEQAAKLAAFRLESEKQGAAILTPDQQAKLEQIRVRRLGLTSLAEPAVREKCSVSDDQIKQIDDIIRQRDKELAKADEKTARIIQAESERKLAAVLSDKQKSAWEAFSGGETSRAEMPKSNGSPAAVAPKVEKVPQIDPPTVQTPEKNINKTADSTLIEQGQSIPDTIAQPSPPASLPKGEGMANVANPPKVEENVKEQPKKHPERLRFNFRYKPWKDVLDWFAEQADMSLVMDSPPPGTFNYTDDREYTPAQAIDVVNSALLMKGFLLIRRDRMLIVINKADGIPPGLVQTITPDQLDQRGEFELVCVLFNLDKLSPEEAGQEIAKLIGSEGLIVPLPKSRQIMVTETGGRLKAIRSLLQRIEDPENLLSGQIRIFELTQAPPEQVLPIIKQMLDISDEKADISLRLAIDPSGRRIIATGKTEKIARLEEIIKAVDVAKPGSPQIGIATTPQLEVYSVATADPQAALQVLQTLLQGLPDVRLAVDPKTNNIVALARPAEHATIRATLDQMQRESRRMEVIRLRVVDPQLAVLSINKFFGITADAKTTPAGAAQVDADLTARQLLIHGSEAQIAQIRQYLEKLGESDVDNPDATNDSNVRMLSVSPRSARSILDQIQGIWPAAHKNKIREVSPSAVIPSTTPGEGGRPSDIPQHLLNRMREESPNGAAPPRRGGPPRMVEPPRPDAAPPAIDSPPPEHDHGDVEIEETRGAPPRKAGSNRTTSSAGHARIWLASERFPANPPAAETIEPLANSPEMPPKNAKSENPKDRDANENEGAPIIVSVGPGGVMIASADTKALDDFERLFTSLAGGALGGSANITIFYLKHEKAITVKDILDQVFNGGTAPQGGGGGGLLGDLAGAAMGETGGGLVGTMLGLGGGGSIKASGPIEITPDSRLNALVVRANANDTDIIEELLKIIDQKQSPEEILIAPKPRMIPLYNTDAEKIAEIVKQVYQDRLVTAGGGAQAQPTPQDFIQMLRGGGRRGGGAGGQRNQGDEVQKMSIGVDTRTNSLIVAAPDPLFQEVNAMVEKLDVESPESSDATKTIVVRHTSPEAIQAALQAFGGENIQFSRTGTSTSSQPGQGQPFMPQFGQGRNRGGGNFQNPFQQMQGRGNFGGGNFGQQPGGNFGAQPGGNTGGGSGSGRNRNSGGNRGNTGGGRSSGR